MHEYLSSHDISENNSAVDVPDCGALRLFRTRCQSGGVISAEMSGEQIGEASYSFFWLIEGRVELMQGMGTRSLLPADMALFDDSLPLTCRVGADGRIQADWLTVQIPRILLPGGRAAHFSGRSGTGRILLDVLRGFLEESPRIDGSARVRLSGVVLDLVTAVLTEQDEQPADDAELQRIQQFAETNLADAELTPTSLAEAHHISVRQLHKLFQKNGLTVSSWIRERRLEGWRRELLNPLSRNKSVQDVARDWGLRSSAHANRLFRGAYGITPAAYRRTISAE
ncbi:AraC family transcriptional regulator [Actinoplanes derwentensis]|uniref:AraC-type DNA-binding protein n=1 Tax=Actinoplanes derwentensis TaxID=113562 RepID=A0A1H2D363_9ACTN|nr:AraC family transcriptional regulator [Actinoplanes derwentensis]GID88316.1 hypothetical protein Ade03nite_72400 [Actinoplanes derwentensis]SDT77185.1 AraC-type DNA-binding protein [Actinoplanes derwentensis]